MEEKLLKHFSAYFYSYSCTLVEKLLLFIPLQEQTQMNYVMMKIKDTKKHDVDVMFEATSMFASNKTISLSSQLSQQHPSETQRSH